MSGFDGPREDGIGHGEDSGPGDADADHRDHQRILVVQQAEPGETCGAQQQAGGVDGPVAPACGDASQEEGGDAGRNGVGAVQHADPGLRGSRREDLARCMVGDNPRDGGLEVGPHEKKGGPREELRDPQSDHGLRDVAHQGHEPRARAFRLGLQVVVAGELLGRVLLGFERGDQNGQQQDGASYIIGIGDVFGNASRLGFVRDAQLRHDQRQDGSDDCSEVDQEGLYHIALGFLPVVEHVGYQGPEGLHRDIEREIHEEQDEGSHGQRGESQQPRAVGHEGQRQRRDDRPPQDVGNAAA